MEELLNNNIQKPGRYIGREWNVSKKDFGAAAMKFALCFPDLYEVGMSNLGVRILYGILNGLPDTVCERCFAPAKDFEQRLKEKGAALFSLESRKPLSAFDMVGFSLGHELSYTNVLTMLEAGGIPLLASERGPTHPLVIGGGPCMANPEPMHAFFDLFLIGEGEDAVKEIVSLYRQLRPAYASGALDKDSLLKAFAGIEGVYAPALYDVEYGQRGEVASFSPRVPGAPAVIRKRVVRDLETAYFPAQWLVPYIAVVHDRITLEVMRGCPNHCRFCQARVHYYPYRMRKADTVVNLARQAYACTGYEEIALGGLSVSDYPFLEEVLGTLIAEYKDKAVSVALPSLKPKAMLGSMSTLIATVKKTGLTFAPEVGSQALRLRLGKDFSDEEFAETLRKSYAAGYQHVKLYFMTGLPHERDTDLDAIVDMALEASRLRKEVSGKFAQVNISINTLIPKPHTPLQWLAMQPLEEVRRTQQYLREKIRKHRWLKVSFHDLSMSFLEGVFSRGDRRLSQVILRAYRKGARFDSWEEHLDMQKWQDSFAECGIDPGHYLSGRPLEDTLPWQFMDMGVPAEFLKREYGETVNKPVDIP